MPPLAVSNRPRLAADRARERAPRVAEQLGFQQRLRQGRAVDGDERRVRARRVRVDRARDQLLAGPGFAFDQHRRRRGGHARDQLVHLQHDGALAHDVLQLGLAVRRDGLLFGDQAPPFDRAGDGQPQLFDVEGLGDVVVSAALDGLHRARHVAERGDQDDGRGGRLGRERRQHVEAAGPLHPHVGDDQVVAAVAALGALDGVDAVVDRLDLVPLAAQDLAQQVARDAVVLGDQHARDGGGHARPPLCARPEPVPGSVRRRERISPPPGWATIGRPAARQAHGEGRAGARRALDRDAAPQRRRQLPADRQAQARSPCRAPSSCRTARRCAAGRRRRCRGPCRAP